MKYYSNPLSIFCSYFNY